MCNMQFSISIYRWVCMDHDLQGDELGCLIGEREKTQVLEAQAAAYREALEECAELIQNTDWDGDSDWEHEAFVKSQKAFDALYTNAGAALLRVVDAARKWANADESGEFYSVMDLLDGIRKALAALDAKGE